LLIGGQSCDGVSEAGVRHLLESLPSLQRLVYHQVMDRMAELTIQITELTVDRADS
jgi:hypothetical protein